MRHAPSLTSLRRGTAPVLRTARRQDEAARILRVDGEGQPLRNLPARREHRHVEDRPLALRLVCAAAVPRACVVEHDTSDRHWECDGRRVLRRRGRDRPHRGRPHVRTGHDLQRAH
eukprot:4187475-Prymnesium_polylepis.1